MYHYEPLDAPKCHYVPLHTTMCHYVPTLSETSQNMAESSNSLLSPINLLVARGNNW